MRAFGFRGMVIGVTGMTSIAMTETFIAHGADRVLLKPIGFNAVYNTVKGSLYLRYMVGIVVSLNDLFPCYQKFS